MLLRSTPFICPVTLPVTLPINSFERIIEALFISLPFASKLLLSSGDRSLDNLVLLVFSIIKALPLTLMSIPAPANNFRA